MEQGNWGMGEGADVARTNKGLRGIVRWGGGGYAGEEQLERQEYGARMLGGVVAADQLH